MPKMPEVTVHVTTDPDPKELWEYKVSSAMWAEQVQTLQRTILDLTNQLLKANSRVAEPSPWEKLRNTLACRSSGIPMPVSEIST